MQTYRQLLSVQLKVRLGLGHARLLWRTERKRFWRSAAVWCAALVCMGALVGVYAWGMFALFGAVRGMPALRDTLVTLLFMLAPLLTLFTGMLTVISVLFFSRDTELLAALPVPERTLFAVKLTQVLLPEYIVSLAMLAPPMLACAPPVGAGLIGYALRCAVLVLCMPIAPLALASALSMLLMRFSVLWRHRDAVMVLGTLVLVGGYLGGQTLLMAHLPEQIDAGLVVRYLLGRVDLVSAVSGFYPPASWARRTMLAEGAQAWLGTLYTLLLALGALAVVFVLAQRIYLRSALAMQESAVPTRHRKRRAERPCSPAMAICRREWRMLLRTPIYVTNSLAGGLMAPIVLLLPQLTAGSELGLDTLLGALRIHIDPSLVTLALAAFLALMAAINPAIGTALSREGRGVWVSLMLPIPAATQVRGKLRFGWRVSALLVLPAALCARWSLGIGWGEILLACVLSLLFSGHVNAVALGVDMLRPNFRWTSPTEIIKQSLNAMLPMLYGMLLLLLLGAASWGLWRLGMPLAALVWCLTALCAALCAVSTLLLLRGAQARYDALRV